MIHSDDLDEPNDDNDDNDCDDTRSRYITYAGHDEFNRCMANDDDCDEIVFDWSLRTDAPADVVAPSVIDDRAQITSSSSSSVSSSSCVSWLWLSSAARVVVVAVVWWLTFVRSSNNYWDPARRVVAVDEYYGATDDDRDNITYGVIVGVVVVVARAATCWARNANWRLLWNIYRYGCGGPWLYQYSICRHHLIDQMLMCGVMGFSHSIARHC